MKAKQILTARDLRLIREAIQAEVYPLKRRIAALEKKLKGPISAIVSIQSELKAVDGSKLRIEIPEHEEAIANPKHSDPLNL